MEQLTLFAGVLLAKGSASPDSDADWLTPAAVLFEREGLQWNHPPRRKSWQSYHADSLRSIAVPIHDKFTRSHDGSRDGLGVGDQRSVFCFQQNTRDEVRFISGDGQIVGALAASPGMKQQNYVVAFSSKDYGADATINLSPTLRAGGFDKSRANAGAPPAIAFMTGDSMGDDSSFNHQVEVSPTLRAGSNRVAVAKSPVVRRLTPIECERLQGFPDDWTQVEYRGKPMADGPRYKMCGNTIAVPVIAWIFGRLQDVAEATL